MKRRHFLALASSIAAVPGVLDASGGTAEELRQHCEWRGYAWRIEHGKLRWSPSEDEALAFIMLDPGTDELIAFKSPSQMALRLVSRRGEWMFSFSLTPDDGSMVCVLIDGEC